MINKLLTPLAMVLALMGCNAPASTPSSVESTAPTPISSTQENSEQKEADKITQQVFELTNAERMKNNLPALKRNEKLDKAAQNHALDMAKNEFLEHTGSDGSKVRDRVEKADYAWQNLAENIAYNQESAEEVVAGWMESEGHRKNILGVSSEEIGLAYAETSKGQPYYVQVFGKPENSN